MLAKTLADLTDKDLIAYYPPPAPLTTPIFTASTDFAVFAGDAYNKLRNKQSYWQYAVDVPNRYTAADYAAACTRWEQSTRVNGVDQPKSASLPEPPAYVVFDPNAFDLWWSELMSTSAATGEAPPLFFIKPAPLPPPPTILAPGAPPAPPPATDGPIGPVIMGANGQPTKMYDSAGLPADTYTDGQIYPGATGVYQKHVYVNFAGTEKDFWYALALTPAPPVVQQLPLTGGTTMTIGAPEPVA